MNFFNARHVALACCLLVFAAAQGEPASAPVTAAVTTEPAAAPDPHSLMWDSESKEYKAQTGETSVPFVFYFTNVSPAEVAITSVKTSCGCTTAQLPPMPWRLPPGTNAELRINMNIAGRTGTNMKTVTVDSTIGSKTLVVKAIIPPSPVAVDAKPAGPADPANAAPRPRTVRTVPLAPGEVQLTDAAREFFSAKTNSTNALGNSQPAPEVH